MCGQITPNPHQIDNKTVSPEFPPVVFGISIVEEYALLREVRGILGLSWQADGSVSRKWHTFVYDDVQNDAVHIVLGQLTFDHLSVLAKLEIDNKSGPGGVYLSC